VCWQTKRIRGAWVALGVSHARSPFRDTWYLGSYLSVWQTKRTCDAWTPTSILDTPLRTRGAWARQDPTILGPRMLQNLK